MIDSSAGDFSITEAAASVSITGEIRHPQISLGNVLYAMDFSPGSLRAYPYAAGIARHYGGKVHVIHVVPSEEDDSMPLTERASLDRLLEAAVKAGLGSPYGSLYEAPVEVLVDHGRICTKLLALAERSAVGMIVIGTHGWRGLNKLLQGSTAEEITYLATRPVLTVGPRADYRAGFKRILYATDFLAAAVNALPYAVSLAESYNADLLVLHANAGDNGEPPTEATPRTLQFVERYLKDFRSDSIENQAKVIVDFAPCVEAILQHARARHVDLIVLGARHLNGLRARIAAHLPGSTAYDVISQAPCPVLTVPLPKKVRTKRA